MDVWLEKRNWTNSSNLPVANRDLWEIIYKLWEEVKTKPTEISFSWVKGHADNYGNILADYMASTGLFHPDERKETLSNPESYYASDSSTSKLLLDSKLYHLYEIKPFVDGQAQYLTFHIHHKTLMCRPMLVKLKRLWYWYCKTQELRASS